jgi:hypothetical protein
MPKYTFYCISCQKVAAIINSDAKRFEFKAWCQRCGRSDGIRMDLGND